MQRTVKDARLIFKPCARYLPTLPSPSLFELPLTIPYPDSLLSSYSRLLDSPAHSRRSVVESVYPFGFLLVILCVILRQRITNWIIICLGRCDYSIDSLNLIRWNSDTIIGKFFDIRIFTFLKSVSYSFLFFISSQSGYWCCHISRATFLTFRVK